MTDRIDSTNCTHDAALARIKELEGKLEAERKAGNDAWHEQEDRLKELESRLDSLSTERVKLEGLLNKWMDRAEDERSKLHEAVNLLRCLVESFDANMTRKAAEFVAQHTPRIDAESVRGILASGAANHSAGVSNETPGPHSEAASVVERREPNSDSTRAPRKYGGTGEHPWKK